MLRRRDRAALIGGERRSASIACLASVAIPGLAQARRPSGPARLGAVLAIAALAAACMESASVEAAPRGRGADAASAARAPIGKPVAPFSVRYELVGTPAVGRPLEVRIGVYPQLPMSALELEAVGDASLVVAAQDAKQSAPSAAADAPAVWSVSVVPGDDGAHELKVTIDGVIDGVREARGVVVPIRVGTQGAGRGESGTQAEPKAGDAESRGAEQGRGDGLIHLHSSE